MLWMQVPIAALKVAIWQDPIGNFPEKAFFTERNMYSRIPL